MSSFGWAGAASQVNDDLVASLVRKHQEQMQQAQLALQVEQANRLREQMDMQRQQTERGNANEKAKTALQYLSPGEITDEQAAPIKGSDYAPALKTITGLSRRGMSGDLASGTMAENSDAGGQQMTVLQPTRAQETAAGEKAQRQTIAGLFKRGASRNELAGAFADAGENVPASLLGEDPTAADARRQTNAVALENLRSQNNIREGAASAAEQRRTNADNPNGKAKIEANSDQYAVETAGRAIEAIDNVLPKIGVTTAGVGGAILGRIGYQPARQVSNELKAVAANIAFNALQQMRAASKTGGALGAISERELELLSSVEGSIQQDSSPENLRAQLTRIKASMQRVQAAASTGGMQPAHAGSGGQDALLDELLKGSH